MLRHLRARPNSRKVLLFTCACIQRAGKEDRNALAEWVTLANEVAEGHLAAKRLDRYETEHDTAQVIHSWALTYVFEAFWLSCGRDWDSDWAKKDRPEERRVQAAQADLVREVFGVPFGRTAIRRAWRTRDIGALARQMYEERAFSRMPELAEALSRNGCTDAAVLAHCRRRGKHVRGCWVVDLILGKK